MNGCAAAARMSPAIPLPPMPSTTTFSTLSRSGRPSSPRATRAAVATCSGSAAVASTIPWVSTPRSLIGPPCLDPRPVHRSATWELRSSLRCGTCLGPPCLDPRPVHRSATWELRSSLRCGACSGPPCLDPRPVHRSATWELRSSLRCGACSCGSGRVERWLDTVGLGLAQEPFVLGVVDGLRLVDEHHWDVVLHCIAPLEPGVVERVLVLEVEERALVLGIGEDLEQL